MPENREIPVLWIQQQVHRTATTCLESTQDKIKTFLLTLHLVHRHFRCICKCPENQETKKCTLKKTWFYYTHRTFLWKKRFNPPIQNWFQLISYCVASMPAISFFPLFSVNANQNFLFHPKSTFSLLFPLPKRDNQKVERIGLQRKCECNVKWSFCVKKLFWGYCWVY